MIFNYTYGSIQVSCLYAIPVPLGSLNPAPVGTNLLNVRILMAECSQRKYPVNFQSNMKAVFGNNPRPRIPGPATKPGDGGGVGGGGDEGVEDGGLGGGVGDFVNGLIGDTSLSRRVRKKFE